jgi:hypothetical protein
MWYLKRVTEVSYEQWQKCAFGTMTEVCLISTVGGVSLDQSVCVCALWIVTEVCFTITVTEMCLMNSNSGVPCGNPPLCRSNVAVCSPHNLQVTWHEPAGCSCQAAVSAACTNFHCSGTDYVWCTPPTGCTAIWQHTHAITHCLHLQVNQHLTMKDGREVKLSPFFINHYHTMRKYGGGGGVEIWLHTFLTLILNGNHQLYASEPLYPQVKSPWYQLDRWLGGSQSHSGSTGNTKISDPSGYLTIPWSTSPQPNQYPESGSRQGKWNCEKTIHYTA